MQKRNRFLSDFQRQYLENSLKKDLSKQYSQRIQIMLLADEGKTQTKICQELGCSQSTARHWIATAKSGQAHQWNHSTIGRPQVMDEQCLERLRELVSHSPKEVKVPNCDFTYSARHWTGKKLSEHLSAELGIKISDRHVNRLLKQMGLSTRPKADSVAETHTEPTRNNTIKIGEIKNNILGNSEDRLFLNFFSNQDCLAL